MKVHSRTGSSPSSWLRAALAAAVLVLAVSGLEPQDAPAPSLDQRLDRLVAQIEKEREALHIPGLAIAIVKDDEVVLARGFGFIDVERERSVTPETIFGIGSTAKAFTAALVGMLVDDGTMRWDDPVTAHLPWFELAIRSDEEGAQVTIRDLLCHRTGFTRMRALYASGGVSREDLLRAATRAEPTAGLRETWQYTNVMYLAAGVAAGEAAESDWDALMSERFFEPLGMTSSTTHASVALGDERLASGYQWEEARGSFRRLELRDVSNIGPAGSVYSNALDMARWVRFQLGRGALDGRRHLSEATHAETWTPQIGIAREVSYGLGWMVREWNGQPVIEHGGNVDGYSCEVALLPESDLGFVMLANVTGAPLLDSRELVWEALLGDWTGDEAGSESTDLRRYVGEYNANFRTFVDQTFRVLVQDGRLAVDLAGQRIVELTDPDEEGWRRIAANNAVAFSFIEDDAGRVVEMRMRQMGIVLTLPRLGLDDPPEIPLAELEKYLGPYRSELTGETFTVRIKHDRLAIEIPGAKTYALRAPDEAGLWWFIVADWMSATFVESGAGEVESMTFRQREDEVVLTKVDVPEGEEGPTVDSILDLRGSRLGRRKLAKLGTFRMRGTVWLPSSGIDGTIVRYSSTKSRFYQVQDYGRFGTTAVVAGDGRSWVRDYNGRIDEMRGIYHEQVKARHPAMLHGGWRRSFDSIAYLRTEEHEGGRFFVVSLQNGDAPEFLVFVDADSGDVIRAETVAVGLTGARMPIVTRYEDFREVEGLRLPFRILTETAVLGLSIIQFEELDVPVKVHESLFTHEGISDD